MIYIGSCGGHVLSPTNQTNERDTHSFQVFKFSWPKTCWRLEHELFFLWKSWCWSWLVAWWVVSPEVLRQEVVEVMIMLLLLLVIMKLIVMSNVQLSITEPITEEAGLVTQQGRQHRYPHTCNSSNIDNQVRKPSVTLSSSDTEPVVKDLSWKNYHYCFFGWGRPSSYPCFSERPKILSEVKPLFLFLRNGTSVARNENIRPLLVSKRNCARWKVVFSPSYVRRHLRDFS